MQLKCAIFRDANTSTSNEIQKTTEVHLKMRRFKKKTSQWQMCNSCMQWANLRNLINNKN